MNSVVRRFELEACPGERFSLPTLVDQPPFRLSSRLRDMPKYSPCPAFTVYALSKDKKEDGFFAVRLNRGSSCSLDVQYGYLGGNEARRAAEQQAGPLTEVVARLLMQGSGVAPKIPATRIERFGSDKEWQRWCARRGDQAERPCGDLHVAEGAGAARVVAGR